MLDVLITGAGIVGSWLALVLSRAGLQVAVCDHTSQGSDGVSGRNSGVLHAGIYYPPGSLKADFCVPGHLQTIEFARSHGVPHDICGKLIVTGLQKNVPDEEEALHRLKELQARALQNGVQNLKLLESPGLKHAHVLGKWALYSPTTGVIDVPAYLMAVRKAAHDAGAIFLMRRKMVALSSGSAEIAETNSEAEILDGGTHETISFHKFINAAGLQSAAIAMLAGIEGYSIRPVRGEYYRLKKRLPANLLIYPLPSTASTALGVHYTFHVNGEAYVGPNAVPAEHFTDYRITMAREEFYNSLQKITDFYNLDDLSPGYSGLRPRLYFGEKAILDFKILHQPADMLHLLGIESPGLTSAPALAEYILHNYF